jgi:hypothetical protein
MNGEGNSASDRAVELKIFKTIPEDDYNRDVEIEARNDGIWIDEFILIPLEWAVRAYHVVRRDNPDTPQAASLEP